MVSKTIVSNEVLLIKPLGVLKKICSKQFSSRIHVNHTFHISFHNKKLFSRKKDAFFLKQLLLLTASYSGYLISEFEPGAKSFAINFLFFFFALGYNAESITILYVVAFSPLSMSCFRKGQTNLFS